MINLRILRIDKVVFEGAVSRIRFYTCAGSRAVFPNHAPLLCDLTRFFSYHAAETNENVKINIESGFFRIENNQAVALIN